MGDSGGENTNTEFSERLREAALADNTRVAYGKGWQCFCDYCAERGIEPLEANGEDVAGFFVAMASGQRSGRKKVLSLGTLTLYRSAITRNFIEAGRASPARHGDVDAVMRGLARVRASGPRRVKALREHDVKAMLDKCPDTLIGVRDAAVLAIGFAGAFRRSELCGLRAEDVEMLEPGRMVIHIRRSKTDQAGAGQRVAIPKGRTVEPIARLQSWIREAQIREGYLFRTMRRGGRVTGSPLHHSDVARLVKHYAASIGLDPRAFSAHSLRAGFVTSAAAHHARLDKIMEITRHKNPATVLQYVRDANSFTDHAGEAFL